MSFAKPGAKPGTKRVLAGLVLLGVGCVVFLGYRPPAQTAAPAPSAESHQLTPGPGTSGGSNTALPVMVTAAPADIHEFVRDEAIRVGQIDPNPEHTEKRLYERARLLNAGEAEALAVQSLDVQEKADARALAAYLLAAAPSAQVLPALARVAASVDTHAAAGRSERIHEQVIRLQAIEGLGHFVGTENAAAAKLALEAVLTKQTDPFLRGHARRALHGWVTGDKNEAQTQDESALKRLLDQG